MIFNQHFEPFFFMSVEYRMINNLRELIYPEIDDAANVFYSKITSIILELYKEHYNLKNYFGIYDSITFNYHFQFGSFTGKTKIKRSEFDPSKVGQYVYAIWKFPYKDLRVDTSESTESTGGKPVPTYQQKLSCDLTFEGLRYLETQQQNPVETFGVKGKTKNKDYICLSCLIGQLKGVKDLYVDIDAYYNSLNIGDKCDQNRYDTVERTNLTYSNKYETDCGRVFKCTAMNNRSSDTVKWWYYSVDSKGIYWLLDSYDTEEPDIGTPQYSSLFNAELILRGSKITTVSYKEDDIDMIEVRICYRDKHVFDDKPVVHQLDVFFEPKTLKLKDHSKDFVSKLLYSHHSLFDVINKTDMNDTFEYALVHLMYACPILRPSSYDKFKPYGKESTKKGKFVSKYFGTSTFDFYQIHYIPIDDKWNFNEFFIWSMWLLGLNPRSYGGSTGKIKTKYRVPSRTYLNNLSRTHVQTQAEFDYYAVSLYNEDGNLMRLDDVTYDEIPSPHVFETSGSRSLFKAVKLADFVGYISEETSKRVPYTSSVQALPSYDGSFYLGSFTGSLPYDLKNRYTYHVSEITKELHDTLYATYNMVSLALKEFEVKTSTSCSILPYFVSGVTPNQETQVKFACKDVGNALSITWSY